MAMRRAAARSGEWVQHFSKASCFHSFLDLGPFVVNLRLGGEQATKWRAGTCLRQWLAIRTAPCLIVLASRHLGGPSGRRECSADLFTMSIGRQSYSRRASQRS